LIVIQQGEDGIVGTVDATRTRMTWLAGLTSAAMTGPNRVILNR
jgi:hypothetical protein